MDLLASRPPISDLLTDAQGKPNRFWIAAYQRGYRWSPLQVTQLLDDVWDFIQASESKRDEFYCLQPLVIKTRRDGSFEVVDGQQRLTTLLLILSYLNRRFSPDFRKTLYHIHFETRRGFDDFLTNPTQERSLENVDFFHIYGAVDRKQFYVTMSRARRSMHLYTDSIDGLREAVCRTGERLSAVELANDSEAYLQRMQELARNIFQAKRTANLQRDIESLR